jgi:hypothetical protein
MSIMDQASMAKLAMNPTPLAFGGAMLSAALMSQMDRPNKLIPSYKDGKYSIFDQAHGKSYDPDTSRYMFQGDKGTHNLYPFIGAKRNAVPNSGLNIQQRGTASYRDAQELLKDDPTAQAAFQQRFGSAPKLSGVNLPANQDARVNWGGQKNGMNLNTVAMRNQAEKQGWGYANDPREVGVLSNWSAHKSIPGMVQPKQAPTPATPPTGYQAPMGMYQTPGSYQAPQGAYQAPGAPMAQAQPSGMPQALQGVFGGALNTAGSGIRSVQRLFK